MAKVKKTIRYKSSNLSVFDSVAEQEESNYNTIRDQDPVQRIKETVKLILKVYGYTNKDLKNRKMSNRIIFR